MDDKQVNVRDKDGFRIPVVPALVGDSSGRHHETDGPTSAKKARIGILRYFSNTKSALIVFYC